MIRLGLKLQLHLTPKMGRETQAQFTTPRLLSSARILGLTDEGSSTTAALQDYNTHTAALQLVSEIAVAIFSLRLQVT